MKVLVAGGTGAIGRRLVALLVDRGYDVSATTRSPQKSRIIGELGAKPFVLDGLDRDAVQRTVQRAGPELIVHQMTGLAGVTNVKHFDKAFARTNRLRTEGLMHLIDAAGTVGTRCVVAQSFGNWNYERTGTGPKTEDDPLDPDPPHSMRMTLAAIRNLESLVTDTPGLDGIALRYGNLYGPGTGWSSAGLNVDLVRQRRLPIIGRGDGVWSFVHVDDAACATVAAIERATPGIYNIVDDEPAPVASWLPELATAVGAKPPRRIPTWLGRLLTGAAGVSMFTQIRGASNVKAKHELGWRLRYSSWRDGFYAGLAEAPIDVASMGTLLNRPPTPIRGRRPA